MEILFIIPAEYKGIGWGGVTTYTLLIAEELAKLNHNITILTPGKKNELLSFNKIPVYKIAYERQKITGQRLLVKMFPLTIGRLKWMFEVYAFLQKQGPYDIIECPEWGASSLLISLLKKNKVNVRLHRSQYQYYLDNKLPVTLDILLVNMLEALSIVIASSVTSPTAFMFRTHVFISWILRIIKTPQKIIPNGIKIRRYPKYQYVKKPFILTVGRLEYGKGLHLLIQAFSKIIKKHPAIQLMFIGRDMTITRGKRLISYKKHLLKVARKEKIDKNLIILPQKTQPQLIEYYLNCLAYVMPAQGHENYPYALLDAIRWKKAIVASDAGGIPEIIKNGKSGLLFKENNVQSLAKTLDKMLTNNELITSIERYNAKYRYNFDIYKTAAKTIGFYEKVLKH